MRKARKQERIDRRTSFPAFLIQSLLRLGRPKKSTQNAMSVKVSTAKGRKRCGNLLGRRNSAVLAARKSTENELNLKVSTAQKPRCGWPWEFCVN